MKPTKVIKKIMVSTEAHKRFMDFCKKHGLKSYYAAEQALNLFIERERKNEK